MENNNNSAQNDNTISKSKQITNSIILGVIVLLAAVSVFYFIKKSQNPDQDKTKKDESQKIASSNDTENKLAADTESKDGQAKSDTNSAPVNSSAQDANNSQNKSEGSDKNNAQGKNPYKLKNQKAITGKDGFISPYWSQDGSEVILTKAKYKGIYVASADGTGMRTISDEDGAGYKVKWSKDGTKLMSIKKDQKKVYDLSGEEITDYDPSEFESENAFSKDDNIYYKNPETGEETQITSGDDSYYNPIESPDGTMIAYEGLTTGVHIKNLETGQVIDLGQGSSYAWTPDGKGVIYGYTQDDGQNIVSGDIYFAYADGSGVFNISDSSDLIELHPRISPDGTKVIYEVDGQIYTADLEDILNQN